jgi:hypothetical protein
MVYMVPSGLLVAEFSRGLGCSVGILAARAR